MDARRARPVALLVAAGLFMNLLDGTVIATALPAMGHAFGTSAVNMNVGITVYLLASVRGVYSRARSVCSRSRRSRARLARDSPCRSRAHRASGRCGDDAARRPFGRAPDYA
jgi:hypothetical protein